MNLKNGRDVEQLVAGIYLNDMCLDRGNALVEEMGKKRKDIKTAFTYLILAWMEVLSKMEYYDARNEDAVQLAKKIYDRPVSYPELVLAKNGLDQETERSLNTDSPRDVANALASYLRADAEERYGTFLNALMMEHRTLQQNFTRMGMCWLKEDCRNRKDLSWICELPVYLPFI